MQAEFKYEKVIKYIYKYYINTEMINDGPIPSEPQLAKIIGISRYPVNQAYNKLVETGVLVKVPGVGTFIKERLPRKFQTKEYKSLVAMASFLNGFSVEIMQGIQDVLIPKGILTTNILNDENQNEEQIFETFSSMGIKGIFIIPQVFFGTGDHPFSPFINRLYSKNLIPMILERPMEGFSGDQVIVDNAGGTAMATEYFINSGRKNIAYIGKDDYIVGKERYQGYLSALSRYSIEPNKKLIYLDRNGDKVIEKIEDFVGNAVDSIFKACPECNTFMTFGASMAYHIYKYLTRKRLFKDNMLFAGYDSLQLAEKEFAERYIALERPLREIGRIGAQTMSEILENNSYGTSIIKRILPEMRRPSRAVTHLISNRKECNL